VNVDATSSHSTNLQPELSQPFAIRGRLTIGDVLEPGAIVVADGRVAEVLRAPRDGALPRTIIDAPIVAPGLIDLQVNGGFGLEIGMDPRALSVLGQRLPEAGVTSYLPTLISSPAATYRGAFADLAALRDARGARALGLHLEGPFLSPPWKGAHPLSAIEEASNVLFEELLEFPELRLMTLAPELPGALTRIRRLRGRGVQVSLGHTSATFEEFLAGVDAGAEMATHLYNAMSPFGHRAPGAIGAALTDERVTVGLIADGVHSHPASLRLAFRAKGIDRVALVTDMMAGAGMPPGRYQLGGQSVVVDDSASHLDDGTLAGAILTLDQAVRNAVRLAGAAPAQALRMATEVPARLLGLTEGGRIVAGTIADLALFDEDLHVVATFIGGEMTYSRT
jgi:N-acetylglucosamine-6-phosphate deacetylase